MRDLKAENESLIGGAWMRGFAAGLAEVHRLLIGGNNSSGIVEVARNCGLTLSVARQSGVEDYDLNELRRAGVK